MSKDKHQSGGICADENFCKGCNNFNAFYNSCKLAEYDIRIGGKKSVFAR